MTKCSDLFFISIQADEARLTHTFITQKIWGSGWDNDIASLRVFMATLRKKLESKPDSPQYIRTHIGIGYRMMKVE